MADNEEKLLQKEKVNIFCVINVTMDKLDTKHINVSSATWGKLMHVKIDRNYRTLDATIDYLVSLDKNDLNVNKGISDQKSMVNNDRNVSATGATSGQENKSPSQLWIYTGDGPAVRQEGVHYVSLKDDVCIFCGQSRADIEKTKSPCCGRLI